MITNGGDDLTYQPDADYSQHPDRRAPTRSPTRSNQPTATVSVTATCVADPATAVDDTATVAEDAAATAIPVLANESNPDGGPVSITAVTQPANGTVVITGGSSG